MSSVNLSLTKQYGQVDYLVIGHITKDLHPDHYHLGGTASYASLTAQSLGKKVGIVTSAAHDLDLTQLADMDIALLPSRFSTTFENIQTDGGRLQTLHNRACDLYPNSIPAEWLNTPIVHLGPVANEVAPQIIDAFPNSLIGLTPQGWMRSWDKKGRVSTGEWIFDQDLIRKSSAAVLSIEDVKGNEKTIDKLASITPILVVTEGPLGSRVYWNGDLRYVKAHRHQEKDPTGAGDIFAAAFFIRFDQTKDVWEAARFATILASHSVNRVGLLGVPKKDEIKIAEVQIVKKW